LINLAKIGPLILLAPTNLLGPLATLFKVLGKPELSTRNPVQIVGVVKIVDTGQHIYHQQWITTSLQIFYLNQLITKTLL
jgi:hypothetical protein